MQRNSWAIACVVLFSLMSGGRANAQQPFVAVGDIPDLISKALLAKGVPAEKLVQVYESICKGLGEALLEETKIFVDARRLLAYMGHHLMMISKSLEGKIAEIIGGPLPVGRVLKGELSDTKLYASLAKTIGKTKVVRAVFEEFRAIKVTAALSEAEVRALAKSASLRALQALNIVLDLYLIGKMTQDAIDACYAEYSAGQDSLARAADQESYNNQIALMLERVRSGRFKLRSGASLSQAVKMLAGNLKANREPFSGLVRLPSDGPGVNANAPFELDKAAGEVLGEWKEIKGRSFRAVYEPDGITWEEAKKRAEELGGKLACIYSKEENDLVFQLVSDPKFWEKNPYQDRTGPWLGGRKLKNDPKNPAVGWAWLDGRRIRGKGHGRRA